MSTKQAKRYAAKPGAQFPKARAQEIGEYLETFGDQVTAEEIVEDASRKASPLHDLFQWDNTKAAHLYRMQQARNILGHIEIRLTVEGGEIGESAFINFTATDVDVSEEESPPTGYHSLAAVARDRRLYEAQKAKLKRELESLRQRYRQWADVISACINRLK